MEELSQKLLALEEDSSVSVVILTGTGRTFAVGANITEIEARTTKSDLHVNTTERIWARILPKLRKPVIAAINGLAFGGGIEIAMMADVVMACA